MKIITALLALQAGGCALGSGDWFAEITPTLAAEQVATPDRDAGDGWQRLNNDYQVRFTSARIDVQSIELLDLGGGGGAAFDPASPPPGYSLCHNGHCHADDGRLVSYEEIAAEQGGGAAAVVALTGAGELDLLAGADLELGCEPGCGLPRAAIGRARLVPAAIAYRAELRDGREPPRIGGLELRVELPADDDPVPAIEGALDLPADREHAPEVALRLVVAPTVALFDGIDFAALDASEGVVDLAAAENADGLFALVENLAGLELGAEVTR
ncbi:MAG TPA: hypothetical protein VNO33_01695 [Kofleriaceae bacterium]|nr:hypothetical protein [Kofleriaceae bacterium]